MSDSTIETASIDTYVQEMLADTSKPASERAAHAAAAIAVHVMTEHRLPMNTEMMVSHDDHRTAHADLGGKCADLRRDFDDLIARTWEELFHIQVQVDEFEARDMYGTVHATWKETVYRQPAADLDSVDDSIAGLRDLVDDVTAEEDQ